ncbi:aspartate aminotransferase family protein [Aquibacillus sp. 3ASR75-11]|uniref:Aspartate aminotransferase family protein n=1 Tax=Terrihalobacillus insolitus TaxID=2950438 RepID=A0A9X4AMZ8_9BACI|nr:aspartate aminotransferase family protein [Terrihalobacillus insolitus]MDC3413794.1 aspartate aminotransferase family protein [Terrihalobacillus insolitus]MDC3425962.1 aspartate aminotransferase family protein [Terrihalobacillus insolitus]
MEFNHSKALYESAKESVPAGVHSNSRYRNPHPIYFKKGEGPWITDVDGNSYLDCIMGNGAIILGHNNPDFNERVSDYTTTGIVTGLETELSIKAAEKFLTFVPTAEKVRYTNTGTEAIMHAMLMARTYTGKNDVAVVEGAFNGWHDAVLVSTWPDLNKAGEKTSPNTLPGSPGLMEDAVNSTLVIPFNDLEIAEQLLTENKDRIAALILEPVMIDIGYIPAKREYLQGLRDICYRLNILLIFDELLTGFRVSPGGAQTLYGITPDLSTFGKAISNGYMLAAVAGRTDVFDTVTPGKGSCSFVGTYNGHQISLAATMAFMEMYEEKNVFQTLVDRTDALIAKFDQLAAKHKIPGRMQGRGGHFHWYFTDKEIGDYRDAAINSDKKLYGEFIQELFKQGVYCSPNYLLHHAISLAHTEEHIEILVSRMDHSLAKALEVKTGS